MSYGTVTLDLADRVATLTFNRPDRLNALIPAMIDEIHAAIDDALAQGARALVLTGAGRAFCSGADLQAGGAGRDLGESVDRYYNPLATRFADLDIPVVTAVNGAAAGAGCGIALAGDIVVMARSAYLLLAFVNIGLVPDCGATWHVARGAGRAKALELALLGERLPAEAALAAGLATRVVDDDAVVSEAQAIAHRLANGPALAIAMIRKQVAAALSSTLAESLAVERDHQQRAGATADFAEAVAAFRAGRPPSFEGR